MMFALFRQFQPDIGMKVPAEFDDFRTMPGRPLLQNIGKIGIGIDYRRAAVFRQSAKISALASAIPSKLSKNSICIG